MTDEAAFLHRMDLRRSIAAKRGTGSPLSPDERKSVWVEHVMRFQERLNPLVDASLRDVLIDMWMHMAGAIIADGEMRHRLEDRVAALEPKPRVKVKAPSRTAA